MHNKFLVLSKGGVPQAVWTGSTNWTEQGIFGHLNCGHVVQGKKIAQQYRDYWSEVLRDLERDPDRAAVGALAARPPDPWTDKITTSFSPQPSTKVLDWYAKLAGGAQDGLFMTFAFGMNKRFLDVYQHDDDVLKLALMEKEGNGSGLAKAREQIAELRKRPNVVVALGNRIPLNGFDRWLRELDRITSPIQVHWIHSKFALIDPLGDDPIVITGSANFSDGSTNENNENMLIIRGDKRVAEIYLTEFMRLFAHYVFRETVAKRGIWNLKDFNPNNLDPTPAWSDRYFKGGQDQRRREYFSGRRTARLAGHVRARDAARTRAGAPAPGRQAARRPGAGPRRRRRGGRT
jgi:phosphatidylserine/phosphatidylglycerophosphate/cardiolipin synthase-like enzyme